MNQKAHTLALIKKSFIPQSVKNTLLKELEKARDPSTLVVAVLYDFVNKKVIEGGHNYIESCFDNLHDNKSTNFAKNPKAFLKYDKTKYPYTIHAEQNLIYRFLNLNDKIKHSLKKENLVIITTITPCSDCALRIAQLEIKYVVYLEEYKNKIPFLLATNKIFEKKQIKIYKGWKNFLLFR